MAVGQSGAAGRHRMADAGGVQADDVGVALADDDLCRVDDGLLRPVEAVQHPALGVHRRLGGVLVLRAVAAGQDPATESDRLAGGIEDGKEQPAAEGIVEPAGAVGVAETGVAEHVFGQRQRPHQDVPPLRGPAQLVAAHHLPVVAPLDPEIPASSGRVGTVQQALVVPGARPLERLVDPGLVLVLTAGVGVVVPQGDPGAGRQLFDRLDEVEVFDLPDEGDHVALGLAAEAVVQPFFGVEGERGRLLGMERAQPDPSTSGLAQGEVLAGEGDEVRLRSDSRHVLVGDPHGRRTYTAGATGDGKDRPHRRPGTCTGPPAMVTAFRPTSSGAGKGPASGRSPR